MFKNTFQPQPHSFAYSMVCVSECEWICEFRNSWAENCNFNFLTSFSTPFLRPPNDGCHWRDVGAANDGKKQLQIVSIFVDDEYRIRSDHVLNSFAEFCDDDRRIVIMRNEKQKFGTTSAFMHCRTVQDKSDRVHSTAKGREKWTYARTRIQLGCKRSTYERFRVSQAYSLDFSFDRESSFLFIRISNVFPWNYSLVDGLVTCSLLVNHTIFFYSESLLNAVNSVYAVRVHMCATERDGELVHVLRIDRFYHYQSKLINFCRLRMCCVVCVNWNELRMICNLVADQRKKKLTYASTTACVCVCVYCTNATPKTIEEILDFFFLVRKENEKQEKPAMLSILLISCVTTELRCARRWCD